MTPKDLAHIHARAMTVPAPWSETDFADLLATPGTFLAVPPSSLRKYAEGSARGAALPSPTDDARLRHDAAQILAFALGRTILDEAELLTLAVNPLHQRKGLGAACLKAFETMAHNAGAARAFLDVAETNQAARALYTKAGWTTDGRRKGYYRRKSGREDAILMSKSLKPA